MRSLPRSKRELIQLLKVSGRIYLRPHFSRKIARRILLSKGKQHLTRCLAARIVCMRITLKKSLLIAKAYRDISRRLMKHSL